MVSSSDAGANVFLLAASNLPWDLDAAMLRRLEKRIMVQLPNLAARKQLLATLLHDRLIDTEGGMDKEEGAIDLGEL